MLGKPRGGGIASTYPYTSALYRGLGTIGRDDHHTYDARGRLKEVQRTGTVNNGVNTTYTVDKADNRTNKTTTGSPNPPPP